jgi:hypothetical protein
MFDTDDGWAERGTLPELFVLYRCEDATGLSGTGMVASGIRWPDGHAAMRWKADDTLATSSTSVWGSVGDLMQVHGHSGRSRILYLDTARLSGSRKLGLPWPEGRIDRIRSW